MPDDYQTVRFVDPEGNEVAEAIVARPDAQPGPVPDVPVTHETAAKLRQAFSGSDMSVRQEAIREAIGSAGVA
jgi:hypothetical protein